MSSPCLDIDSAVESAVAQYRDRLATSKGHTPSLLLGLSGGIDSMVLLHALSTLSQQSSITLSAMYIHHGVSEHADDWAHFCESVCIQYDVPFFTQQLTIPETRRTSWEAEARRERYAALFTQAAALSAVVVTAHHQDDQLETVLLQLKRGAGLKGLSGMSVIQQKQQGQLFRPLLSVSRSHIEAYAQYHKLSWVEDASNLDEQFDRNFLRQSILPLLTTRWPAMASTVARSAKHCAESQRLIDDACESFWPQVSKNDKLMVSALLTFSYEWQKALVRHWFDTHSIAAPSEKRLEQVISACHASEDKQPRIKVGSHWVRRYDDMLWLCTEDTALVHTSQEVEKGQVLQLPLNGQYVSVVNHDVEILSVTYGEYFHVVKPMTKPHSKRLSAWFKEWRIPPWLRSSVPLLIVNSKPVAILLSTEIVLLSHYRENEGYEITLL